MRRLIDLAMASTLLALVAHPALAQQPTAPPAAGSHEHGQQAPQAQGQPPAPQRSPDPGAGPGGMMGGRMMDEGMGGMMGAMRGGRGGEGPLGLCPSAAMLAHHDARAMARSLKLCGDLLKAMGDVLLKHGAELERTPPPPGSRR